MLCYSFSIFLETFPYCLDCDAFDRIERFRGSSRSNCCAIAGWAFGDRELLIAASLPPRQSTQRAVSSNSSIVTLWSFLSILLSFWSPFLCHLIWIYCVFNLQWIDWFVCCRLCSWVYLGAICKSASRNWFSPLLTQAAQGAHRLQLTNPLEDYLWRLLKVWFQVFWEVMNVIWGIS